MLTSTVAKPITCVFTSFHQRSSKSPFSIMAVVLPSFPDVNKLFDLLVREVRTGGDAVSLPCDRKDRAEAISGILRCQRAWSSKDESLE